MGLPDSNLEIGWLQRPVLIYNFHFKIVQKESQSSESYCYGRFFFLIDKLSVLFYLGPWLVTVDLFSF